MGMPAVPAYINVALLMGPVLAGLGISTFTAHMFIFYFAVASAITPPVALAAFAAATIAEDTLSRYQRIAKDTVQSSLTLATGVDGVWIGRSVAEDTMEKYDPDRKPRNTCWGCGSPDHSFANRKTVTCPNKDKPAVIEKAAKVHKEFNERLAAKKKAAKSGRDRSGKSTLVTDL